MLAMGRNVRWGFPDRCKRRPPSYRAKVGQLCRYLMSKQSVAGTSTGIAKLDRSYPAKGRLLRSLIRRLSQLYRACKRRGLMALRSSVCIIGPLFVVAALLVSAKERSTVVRHTQFRSILHSLLLFLKVCKGICCLVLPDIIDALTQR